MLMWSNRYYKQYVVPLTFLPLLRWLLPHLRHALLNNRAYHLVHNLRSRQRSLLALPLVSGRNLDNIGTHHVQALNAPDDPDQLARRPPAGLGGARAGRERRVEDVNVHGQVDGVVRGDGVQDRLDDARGPQVVDVVGDHAQPVLRRVVVKVVPPIARQPGAQARVHRGPRRVVDQQALGARQPEHGAVVEVRLVRQPARGVLGRVPRVEVRVEVQHPQRPAVDGVERPQRRQREAVVTPERDELGLLEQRGQRPPAPQLCEGLGHLPYRHGIVDRHDGDVPAVHDLCPALIGVDVGPRVEAAEARLPRRSMPDGPRSKSCA
ncbi:hypothetical protein FJTKL_01865 [Diaporthe vaccinii]|uniref:Uncharacterized protein n=1 Tax=Diaporthe vaccinii TaxID=105482 RepID=A0ABR4F4K3_9PEZI